MFRYLAILLLALSIVGCGSGSEASSPDANSPTMTGQDPTKAGAVTMDKPTEEKIGKTTLKELSDRAGIATYPGAEKAEGDTYKRGDGGFKDDVTFETDDSLEKVAKFFEEQGLDTKVLTNEATSMGHTKGNANLIIAMSSGGKKTTVTLKSVRYDEASNKPN